MDKFADSINYTVRLADSDDYTKIKECFHSGNTVIDNDFATSEFDRRFVSYVVINNDNGDIIACYSLGSSACIYSIYDKSYFTPAIEITLFAVDERYQDIKTEDGCECLSAIIFYELLSYISYLTDEVIGATKVILYATPKAIPFYTKCGFGAFENNMLQNQDSFLDGCTPMYIDIT